MISCHNLNSNINLKNKPNILYVFDSFSLQNMNKNIFKKKNLEMTQKNLKNIKILIIGE